MIAYAARRLLLMVPTLFAIMVLNFVIIQAAPGGPVEQMIAKIKGSAVGATERVSAGSGEIGVAHRRRRQLALPRRARHRSGADPAARTAVRLRQAAARPLSADDAQLSDLQSRHQLFPRPAVTDLIKAKLPVSISIGLWTTLITYLVSIPLGIRKAVKDGSRFDVWTSALIIVGYAVPSFMFAILLIVLFAGGSYLTIFPLRGLVSDNWASLSLAGAHRSTISGT